MNRLGVAFCVIMILTAWTAETKESTDPQHDMIRALAAPGPHFSIASEATVFDQMVGTWDCDFGFYGEGGKITHVKGELLFGWIIDGRAIQDIWISYPPGKERGIGTSIRFFDTKLKVWRVVFISPAYNGIVTVQGGVEEGRIILRGTDQEGNKLRWSFNDIQRDSFIWRGETSYDGGKTWKLEEEHHMKRRLAAAN
jgi:hypothetical protein